MARLFARRPRCSHCGMVLRSGAALCPACGQAVASQRQSDQCPSCGARMGDGDACPICGAEHERERGHASDRAFRVLLSVMALAVLVVMAWTLWPSDTFVAAPAPTATPVPRMANAVVLAPTLEPTLVETATTSPPAPATATPTMLQPTPTLVMRRHVVAAGEHLGVIASKYDLDEGTIARANGIGTASILQIGQELVIPPVTMAPYTFPTEKPTPVPTLAPTLTPSLTPVGGVVIHVVVAGDNLGSLSARYNVETRSIADANGIPLGTILAIGQELVIPGVLPTPTSLPTVVPTQTWDTAMVAAIARLPQTSSAALAEDIEGTGNGGAIASENDSKDGPDVLPEALVLDDDAGITGPPDASPTMISTPTATIVPSATPTLAPSPTPMPTRITHVVASGDTLLAIALEYDVEVEDITRANALPPDTILQVGQGLTIPHTMTGVPISTTLSITVSQVTTPMATATYTPTLTATAVVTFTATPTATMGPLIHIVESGDTVGAIAVQYDVASQDILTANNLGQRAILSIGQEIIIPGAELTVTPTPTQTSTPTAIPTVRVLLRPTLRPTSAFPYGSPRLLAPINDVAVVGEDTRVVLNWASVGILDEDEWYLVQLWIPDGNGEPMRIWTKATSWRLSKELYPKAEGAITFEWQVAVYSRASETDRGTPASLPSARYRFSWQ